MEIYSTYSVKIKHFNSIFKQTVSVYRDAVDFLIAVYLEEWDTLSLLDGRARNNYAIRKSTACYKSKSGCKV